MTLFEVLSSFRDQEVLVSGDSGEWTAQDLLSRAELHRSKLSGRRVAIQLADPTDGIVALLAADGQAEAITLLPPTLSKETLQVLSEQSESDLLIGGPLDSESNPKKIECYTSLDLVPEQTADPDKNAQPTKWNLATSGTTKSPRLVSHSLAGLTRTTKRKEEPSADNRWGLLYDYTRFAGLQVVLQSLFSASSLIVPSPHVSLAEKIALLVGEACTHLSATPSLWRAIVMTPCARDLPLRQITLGGEIADVRILSTLKEMYPNARITQIYASTETGVGFSVNDGLPGFPASYLQDAPNGIGLRLFDGRLQIKKTEVKRAYVGTSERISDEEGWINTCDDVEIIGDRVFFLGRANGVINVGGNKVHPEEIESLLCDHPLVRSARVFGKPNPIMGTLVAAEVVPNEEINDERLFSEKLKNDLRGSVPAFKVPVSVTVVDQIEITSTGKISRAKTK